MDFDFYNPEEVDYHALKRLLGQLFASDAELIEVNDLVDIIIEENQVGTTIKVDGQESDPYAILSVINLQEQKVKARHKARMHWILFPLPIGQQGRCVVVPVPV